MDHFLKKSICVFLTVSLCFSILACHRYAEYQSAESHLTGVPRASEWPRVREDYLKDHSECAACGSKKDLQVHHKIPFSFDPKLELDANNLITLCVDGPGHLNCHLVIGHGGNFKCYNPNVEKDAKRIRSMLLNRKTKE